MLSKRVNRCFWILMLCLGATACTGLFKNYGAINPNDKVTAAFEAYEVNAAFRYYVSGAHHYPNALIGLHRDYRLDPRTTWRPVEMSTAAMKEIVEAMKTKALGHRMFQYGFTLADPQENPIGVWYSPLEARTFIKMNEDGTVRIDTPPLDVYERLERDAQVDSSN